MAALAFFTAATVASAPALSTDNGSGLASDGGFEQLSLFHRIVIVDQDERLVAKRFCFLRRRIGEGFEKRILRRGHNDGDQLVFRRSGQRDDGAGSEQHRDEA